MTRNSQHDVTRNCQNDRLTVEKLAADCLDVRELHRVGAFKGGWKTFPSASFRWPSIEKMRAAKFLIQVQFFNQTVPQNIRVCWTWCNFGGSRPWLVCQCGRRVARLFKGMAVIIADPAAANRSTRASAGARRRGPIYRLIGFDSGSAARARWSIHCQHDPTV